MASATLVEFSCFQGSVVAASLGIDLVSRASAPRDELFHLQIDANDGHSFGHQIPLGLHHCLYELGIRVVKRVRILHGDFGPMPFLFAEKGDTNAL